MGAALAIAGMVLLIISAVTAQNAMYTLSACIYGSTLILMYLFSTLYHSITNPKAKEVFRIFDHASIFLLIAGTYTPYTLITLWDKPIGKILFAGIWACAVLGVVLNAVNLQKYAIFCHVCYIAMGWGIIFAFRPLMQALAPGGIIFLLAGGVAYTLGIIFFSLTKYRYMHSVWHFFVLGGSVLHFFSIYLYVFNM